ncbi:MAG TPA: dTMP kinase, partial [Bacteroidia bacterium]
MQVKTIEIEGLDGSGKTTSSTYVKDKLEQYGYKVLLTREVGSDHIPVCLQLRELVLNPNITMDGKAMEFIFAAMRIENQRFYESVKDQYDFVLSDRGWLSHLAYTDHNVSKEFTKEFYKNVVAKYTKAPDFVIYLEIDPMVAAKRRNVRGEVEDAIENKGVQFQEKVGDSFRTYLIEGSAKDEFDFYKIDAEKDVPGVRE